MLTRADALALDEGDPLASWRDEFVIADESLVYLDGNSLGMMPRRTVGRLQRVLEQEWAGGLIRSWDSWLDLPQRVGDRLAPIIGANPGEVAVHDSTTVNLYQLIDAACALRPDRVAIAISPVDFPTDRYVVEGIARVRGLQVRDDLEDPDDVAVVVRSVVDYRTAEVVTDLAAATARASAAGCLSLWDLSHAAGVLPVDLAAAGVQLAVGCTYKYLNGGPGSPAFSFVATELQPTLPQPIWGWFAQADQFEMGPTFSPHPDIRRVLLGTPSILALAAAEEGIAVTVEAGIEAIAEKARALTGFGIDLCDQLRLATSTPRDPARRGGHLAVNHPLARRLITELAAHGVITDFRDPDIVRIGCSPLTTRFRDVFDGLTRLAALINQSAV
ncbi:MAG: kynureninase [Ilumatobacteraceae bacterium]